MKEHTFKELEIIKPPKRDLKDTESPLAGMRLALDLASRMAPLCILLLEVWSGSYQKHTYFGSGDTQFQQQLGRRTRETGKKVEG